MPIATEIAGQGLRVGWLWRAGYLLLRGLLLLIFALSSLVCVMVGLGLSATSWLQSRSDQPLMLAVAFLPILYFAIWRLRLTMIRHDGPRRAADLGVLVALIALQIWAASLIPVGVW